MENYQYEVPMEVLNSVAIIHNYANWLENKSRPRQHDDAAIAKAIHTVTGYKDGAIANPQQVRCEHGSHYGSAAWLPALEFTTPCGCRARIIQADTTVTTAASTDSSQVEGSQNAPVEAEKGDAA